MSTVSFAASNAHLLTKQDWQAKWITAPEDDSVAPHFGFRTLTADASNAPQWVQVDLGKVADVDAIKLWGSWPVSNRTPPGDGFPRRFKIEVSSDAGFSAARTVVDRTDKDYPNPGIEPVFFEFDPVPARYVRLTATLLSGSWKRQDGQTGIWDDEQEKWLAIVEPKTSPSSDWHLALAEMQVFAKGKNIAEGAVVSAPNAIENDPRALRHEFEREGWRKELLTDGRTESTPGSKRSPQPVTLFRKPFESEGAVKRATLHATALGLYEFRLNGEKVGDQFLAPGWSNFDKRTYYQTFDVTDRIRSGANMLGAKLADGWYRMRLRNDHFGSAQRVSRDVPALLMGQLEIEYDDGRREVIATDSSWQTWPDGPIRYASIFDGVIYDARKQVPGWDLPGPMQGWQPAIEESGPGIELNAQPHEPVRILNEFEPVEVAEPKPGLRIYDFGTSMAGFCRARLSGPAGASVKLRYAEALKPDGTLYVGTLNGNYDNFDQYILDGKGPLEVTPDFTYHGFRYVEVTGELDKVEIEDITALDISSDLKKTAFFESSDPRLNKLVEIIDRAYRANTPSISVDVAGRDERQAWLGDCFTNQTRSRSYLYSSADFFRTTVQGCVDGINPNGLPWVHSAKTWWSGRRDSTHAGWADALIHVAWDGWINYGDRRLLEMGFDGASRFMDAVAKESKNGLPGKNFSGQLGDWLSSRQTIRPGATAWDQLGGKGAPSDVFAAAVWAESLDLTSKIAAALGKGAEARKYEELRDSVRAAILREYVGADGTVKGHQQGGYALVLPQLPPEVREKAHERLMDSIKAHQTHFATGSFTTIYLLRYLADNGLQDLAWQLVMQPTCPSFGFMVDNGASAMWERFDSYHPELGFNPAQMNGLIHLGMNSVYEWIFASLAGIRPDPEHPGYEHFFIQPVPPKDLNWVKASYESVRGPIEVEWKQESDRLLLKGSVPAGTTATLVLPGFESVTINDNLMPGEQWKLAAGSWSAEARKR